MQKYIFVGNGNKNWIIKEIFKDVVENKLLNAEFWNPYIFPNKETEQAYNKMYFSKNRDKLQLYSNARWRQYSSLNNLSIEDGDIVHLFFLFGRDVERLFDPILLKALNEKFGAKVITYLLLFDSIDVTPECMGWGNIKKCFAYFDVVATFDEVDALKYDLVKFTTPYSVRNICSDDLETDLYFIGEEKGRENIINFIADKAIENGLNVLFEVMNGFHCGNNIKPLRKVLSYDEVLKRVVKTKCVVEILADGQQGSTLRYYEAIAYNKKLLTNNKNVLKMPYYNKEYIQYFDDVEDIDFEWIKKDVCVNYCYDGRYSVQSFINSITNNSIEKVNNNVLVSVIIPTYNREKTLLRSVYSVLNQTYREIEVIVVDDGSTDLSIELLEEIQDSRLKIITQENMGACVARNVGIANCKGNFIAFQDSDDEWKPDKLEKQVDILLNNLAVDIVFCNANKIDMNNGTGKLLHTDIQSGIISRYRLQGCSLVSTQTILARRECFEIETFDRDMPRLQDYDIVIRLAEIFTFWYISEPLVNMYVQVDSISNNPQKAIDARYRLFEKYPELYKENQKMYLSTLQSILANSNQLGVTDINAEREYYYLRQLEQAREDLDKLKKVSELSNDTIFNSQFRFELGKEDGVTYTTLRRTGTKGSREIQFVTTVNGKNIKWNKLINSDGSKNWITPNELRDILTKYENTIQLEHSNNEHLEYCLDEIKKSFSYKIGRIISWFPRLVRHVITGKPM